MRTYFFLTILHFLQSALLLSSFFFFLNVPAPPEFSPFPPPDPLPIFWAREPLPPFVSLAARRPASGWVAISALARTRAPADYAWLDAYQPVERDGKSIDLYYIP